LRGGVTPTSPPPRGVPPHNSTSLPGMAYFTDQLGPPRF
jgi:hypothetical protein